VGEPRRLVEVLQIADDVDLLTARRVGHHHDGAMLVRDPPGHEPAVRHPCAVRQRRIPLTLRTDPLPADDDRLRVNTSTDKGVRLRRAEVVVPGTGRPGLIQDRRDLRVLSRRVQLAVRLGVGGTRQQPRGVAQRAGVTGDGDRGDPAWVPGHDDGLPARRQRPQPGALVLLAVRRGASGQEVQRPVRTEHRPRLTLVGPGQPQRVALPGRIDLPQTGHEPRPVPRQRLHGGDETSAIDGQGKGVDAGPGDEGGQATEGGRATGGLDHASDCRPCTIRTAREYDVERLSVSSPSRITARTRM
jgi:hypothetical protein